MRPPVTFAIMFDLDVQILQDLYPSHSWNDAHTDIRSFLEENDFEHKQGSVYFGGNTIDVVRCVIVAQTMSRKFPWFAPSVKDMRMLRIEENNDLMQAVELALRTKGRT